MSDILRGSLKGRVIVKYITSCPVPFVNLESLYYFSMPVARAGTPVSQIKGNGIYVMIKMMIISKVMY